MTVKMYLDQINENYPEKVRPIVMDCEYVWSNNACNGYCAAALRNLGATEAQIRAVLGELHTVYDTMAVYEAEAVAS